MAKSVLDAGWGQLKTILNYKCARAGIVFKDVHEVHIVQAYSSSDALPDSRLGFGIRRWTYCAYAVRHNDRDVNLVRNILAVGHGRLAVGILRLGRRRVSRAASQPGHAVDVAAAVGKQCVTCEVAGVVTG